MKTILLFAASVGAAGAIRSRTQQCCDLLSDVLPGQVFLPGSEVYQERLDSIWSVGAALAPWCVALPESTEDTSHLMHTISSNECPFGIRSGGHTVWSGSASVDDGLTIDLGRMNATAYSPDSNIAHIQPGGTWGSVYDALAPYGVAVAGGRGSAVGIAGFLLGGGNSFFNNAHGLGSDTVEAYEIVLANGTVILATKDEHYALWRSLKGGSGNFGIVTNFDVRGIPLAGKGDKATIWGGAAVYEYGAPGVIPALVNFAKNAGDHPASSTVCSWGWLPQEERDWLLVCSLQNVDDVPDSPAFDELLGLDEFEDDTLESKTLLVMTQEQDGVPGEHNIWVSGTFSVDERIMKYALSRHDELAAEMATLLSSDPVKNTLLQFQPISESMVSAGANINVLGLKDQISSGPGIMMILLIQVDTQESEDLMQPVARKFQDDVDSYAEELGLAWRWKYLNYVEAQENPIARYGEENVRLLKETAKKYDPQGVFQTLRKSGHKLP